MAPTRLWVGRPGHRRALRLRLGAGAARARDSIVGCENGRTYEQLGCPVRKGALLEPAVTALRAKLAEDLRGAEGLKETEDGGAETLVFYQSSDGQLIFLEPHLMKQLLSSYSTWARLPPSVLLKPLKSMRQEALTDEMKKRQMDRMDLPGEWVTDDGFEVHRFLQHLPSDAAGNLIAFADGEVLAGDEGKSNGKGRKGKGRRKPREPRDGAGRERLESQESKASASFSGADGHTGSEPLASPSLAPEPEPAQEGCLIRSASKTPGLSQRKQKLRHLMAQSF
ncbi:unnamed protein product [Durusdinium trenchii]|uniref:Uncharacterized protein n=1 Tax=Durusdinium trenchii TaxID=1381693 RepID=A0ABP0QYH7_9DINO